MFVTIVVFGKFLARLQSCGLNYTDYIADNSAINSNHYFVLSQNVRQIETD